jgi:hypothetical protein
MLGAQQLLCACMLRSSSDGSGCNTQVLHPCMGMFPELAIIAVKAIS